MTTFNNEVRELTNVELDAVIGAGPTVVGVNEQIAHFLSIHERTTVVESFELLPRPTRKK